MGVSGRRWRLPNAESEIVARAKLLAALGVGEQAIVDAPPKGERQTVAGEFFDVERRFLIELAHRGGLTRNPSPGRAIRLLVRAVIANRDLLPFVLEIDDVPAWLDEVGSLEDRLASWLDQLSDDVLEQLLAAVKSAIARRRKQGGKR